MAHPYRIREIAQQSGLSPATVDRVLNGRAGVRASTADEVRRAIADLDRQRSQLRLAGRTFVVDVVMQSPERFSRQVRAALEAELPLLHPAVFRSRFHFRETGTPEQLAAVLDRIAARGSHGVVLKAPDAPAVRDAVDRLGTRGIPVVTLVTDLPGSRRSAYVGIDNRAAGATAAYLVEQWLAGRPGDVLVTLSRSWFRGEEERERGFRAGLAAGAPGRGVLGIQDSEGLDDVMGGLASAALRQHPSIVAVYSAGGGNRAILRAFAESGRQCAVFVAHDLDDDNRVLLREGRLSAVLHHDLRADLRTACRVIMRAQGTGAGAGAGGGGGGGAGAGGRAAPLGPVLPSSIQVVTPFNLP